jgi:hypothetical protein
MTGAVDTEMGMQPLRTSEVCTAKSFMQEWADFARDYPFRAFVVRLLMFILFFRLCLDIVIEVMMIRSSVTSPLHV